MTKKLTTKELDAPAPLGFGNDFDWGDEALDPDDIVIPRLLLLQALSKLVEAEKARPGEIADSVTGEVLGNIKKPVEFIPFHLEKKFHVYSNNEYDHSAPYDKTLPKEETIDGNRIDRRVVMQFYVLVPDQIKKGNRMPYVIPFKSMGTFAGKNVQSQMRVRNRVAGLCPAGSVMALDGTKESNNKGTFYVPRTSYVRASTKEEIKLAMEWVSTINNTATYVDEGEA
jgi:hypothetical protein